MKAVPAVGNIHNMQVLLFFRPRKFSLIIMNYMVNCIITWYISVNIKIVDYAEKHHFIMKCIYLIKTSVLIICYFTLEYMTKTGCSYRILKFTFLSRVQWYSVHTSQLIHYIYSYIFTPCRLYKQECSLFTKAVKQWLFCTSVTVTVKNWFTDTMFMCINSLATFCFC